MNQQLQKPYHVTLIEGAEELMCFKTAEVPFVPRVSDVIVGGPGHNFRVLQVQVKYQAPAGIHFDVYIEKV